MNPRAIRHTVTFTCNRRPPASTSSGNSPSVLTVLEWIQVGGTLQAGSLEVTSKSVTMSGKIDVSGGGYLTNQGPGKELVFKKEIIKKSRLLNSGY